MYVSSLSCRGRGFADSKSVKHGLGSIVSQTIDGPPRSAINCPSACRTLYERILLKKGLLEDHFQIVPAGPIVLLCSDGIC